MFPTRTENESRRVQRLALRLSLQVEVRVGRSTTWCEDTRSEDISAYGVALNLARPVKDGRVVRVSVAMPRELRLFDVGKPEYCVWGVVRRCIQAAGDTNGGSFSTGIAFIGKDPPSGFYEHPSRLYDVSKPESPSDGFWCINNGGFGDENEELRKESRYPIPESLKIGLLDESDEIVAVEPTVTENISIGGAVVFTQFHVDIGSFLRVSSERNNWEAISIVRGRSDGPGGASRLHIEYIDNVFPIEGIG